MSAAIQQTEIGEFPIGTKPPEQCQSETRKVIDPNRVQTARPRMGEKARCQSRLAWRASDASQVGLVLDEWSFEFQR